MLQLTPHMKILIALEPVDGRKGIDSLAALCRGKLEEDPFSGTLFLFLNRSRTTMRVLVFDGQGFFLAQKRLSQGRFKWPTGDSVCRTLDVHQVQMLLMAGDPETKCAPNWRPIKVQTGSSRPKGAPQEDGAHRRSKVVWGSRRRSYRR